MRSSARRCIRLIMVAIVNKFGQRARVKHLSWLQRSVSRQAFLATISSDGSQVAVTRSAANRMLGRLFLPRFSFRERSGLEG